MRRRSFLALSLAAATARAAPAGDGEAAVLEPAGSFRWRRDEPGFGGFSGIHVAADGEGFIAISDRGRVTEGRLLRDAGLRITGAEAGPMRQITVLGGRVVPIDAEGIAVASDGRVFISDEFRHRIGVSRSPGREIAFLQAVPEPGNMRRNLSFEALAVDARGTLYTLPEVPQITRHYPVYRFLRGRWSIPFELRRDADWAAVGADFGPDGLFYLLERGFSPTAGFRSRIRRFRIEEDGAFDETLLLETRWREHGNLEGLSVWQDSEGHLRFTMISDDNFLPILLHTDIVEYRAREPLDRLVPAQ